jgi:DNA-binding response OmpR family regulator
MGQSLRDRIEILLNPGPLDARREALDALAAVPAPLVVEALSLATELEPDGPLAPAVKSAREGLIAKLGTKAAALSFDPRATPFMSATSPFRPLGLVASGTDARTYLAVQRGLMRLVSLKVLQVRTPEASARFLADARQLSRTMHPHLATVIEAGTFGNQTFVAAEMVDGRPLQQVIEAGAVPVETALRYLREAASGLAAAHRVGIAHGRLLPTTVLLDRDDRIKLTEFAPAAGPLTHEDVARDVRDLGLLFLELLSGALAARPPTGPVPVPDGLPEPVLPLARSLSAVDLSDPTQDAPSLLAAIDDALARLHAAANPGAGRVAAADRKKVLVVDDEPLLLELAALLLEPAGYCVLTAMSLREALGRLAAESVDAVLTDLNFPDGHQGVELVKRLHSIPGAPPVVAMSGSPDASLWEEVLREGVAGVVAKPLDMVEVLAVIDRAITRRKPKILFVDDSPLARRIFKRYFENRGFETRVVPGVANAMGEIDADPPDIVVADLNLVDGSGLDVLTYIHENRLAMKVIMVSDSPNVEAVIRAHRMSVYDFVNKSEDPRYLLRSVERAVTGARVDS